MFAVKALARVTPTARLAIQSQRTVVSGPPLNPLSFWEKLAHGTVMVIAFTAVPIYVLVNLKNYRKD